MNNCLGFIGGRRLYDLEFLDNIKYHNLNSSFGKPSDVASLVNFLISKNASYITGQIINLDGGMVT